MREASLQIHRRGGARQLQLSASAAKVMARAWVPGNIIE
jgi:hypothetical protein